MAQTIRYHLDEHCPNALAEGLRRRGINVTTTAEAGLQAASDEEHVAFALREGRVIFTQDEDFLAINAAGVPHAGIAYCHQGTRSVGEIIRGLVLIWDIYEPKDMHNHVEWL
jgi:predicted nuclease of predicted toxin-antitoxin system